jgi:hypothetical protein
MEGREGQGELYCLSSCEGEADGVLAVLRCGSCHQPETHLTPLGLLTPTVEPVG